MAPRQSLRVWPGCLIWITQLFLGVTHLSCSREIPIFRVVLSQYNPIRNRHSRRYHVSVNHTVYELLITEDKWYNCHTRTGGGGAIDLTMHLYREKFIQAVRRLDRGMKERTNTPSGYDYEKRSDHSWTHGA